MYEDRTMLLELIDDLALVCANMQKVDAYVIQK